MSASATLRAQAAIRPLDPDLIRAPIRRTRVEVGALAGVLVDRQVTQPDRGRRDACGGDCDSPPRNPQRQGVGGVGRNQLEIGDGVAAGGPMAEVTVIEVTRIGMSLGFSIRRGRAVGAPPETGPSSASS